MGKGRARQLIAAAVPARPAGRHGRRRGISRGNGQEQNQGWAGLGRMRLRPDSRSAARCCRARQDTALAPAGLARRGGSERTRGQFPLVAPADSCQDPSSAGVRKGAGGSAVAGQRASLVGVGPEPTRSAAAGSRAGRGSVANIGEHWAVSRRQASIVHPAGIAWRLRARQARCPALLAPAQHAPLT